MEGVTSEILEAYNLMINLLPNWVQNFVNFFFLVLLIVFYSVLVWKLYKFISKKNPLGLNLNKYNKSENPFFAKLLAGTLYFVEYILILPFIIFLVFTIFTFFLIVLAQNQEISQILIISATVIAAIRMTAYYKEDLSQEIAKMLPLTLLAVAVLNPTSFSQAQYVERILNLFTQIPSFFGQILHYLIFIISIEIILITFDFFFSLFNIQDNNIKEGMDTKEVKVEK